MTARPLPLAPLLLLLLLGLAGVAPAQVCHVENDGPTFNDLVATGGPPLLIAVRFSPFTSFTASGIELFTGEGTGSNGVAIWSHDGFANEPLAPLGTGSWSMSATNQWQGAPLFPPVPLNAGTLYWMVWEPQPGAQSSQQVGTTPGQIYRGSFDGGATWNGPFQSPSVHWKFRIECCSGFLLPYGAACPGLIGAPALAGSGCPTPGETIVVEASNMLAGQPALLLLGSNNLTAPIDPFCSVHNLPWIGSGTSFTVGPLGTLTLPGTIPIGTAVPADVYLQVLVSDPGAPGGIAVSNALQVHIE
ncbi:MAG: hypothetical protein ACF8XB_12815 [Planctomycetota bacterium JB042]